MKYVLFCFKYETCFDSSVSFEYFLWMKHFIWFLYRCLNVCLKSCLCALSFMSLLLIVALYAISLLKHLFHNRHTSSFLQYWLVPDFPDYQPNVTHTIVTIKNFICSWWPAKFYRIHIQNKVSFYTIILHLAAFLCSTLSILFVPPPPSICYDEP